MIRKLKTIFDIEKTQLDNVYCVYDIAGKGIYFPKKYLCAIEKKGKHVYIKDTDIKIVFEDAITQIMSYVQSLRFDHETYNINFTNVGRVCMQLELLLREYGINKCETYLSEERPLLNNRLLSYSYNVEKNTFMFMTRRHQDVSRKIVECTFDIESIENALKTILTHEYMPIYTKVHGMLPSLLNLDIMEITKIDNMFVYSKENKNKMIGELEKILKILKE